MAALEEGDAPAAAGTRPARRERRQAHAAAANAGDRLELGLRGRQAGDDHLGVLDQRAARRP